MARRLLECGMHPCICIWASAVESEGGCSRCAIPCTSRWLPFERHQGDPPKQITHPAGPESRATSRSRHRYPGPRGRHPVRLDLAISGGGPPPAPPPPDIHAQMHTPVALALAPIARRRWPPRVLAAPRITQIKLTSPLPGLRSARAAYFFGATRPHISSQASWRVFGRRLRAGPQHPKPTRASSTQADSATAPCTV